MSQSTLALLGVFRINNFGDDLLAVAMSYVASSIGWNRVLIPGLSDAVVALAPRAVPITDEISAIQQAHVVVLGGGGYFGECGHSPYDEAAIDLLSVAARSCRETSTPLYILGPGANRLLSGRHIDAVKFACSVAKRVLVRDIESHRTLRALDIAAELASDAVFLLPQSLLAGAGGAGGDSAPRDVQEGQGHTGRVLVQSHSGLLVPDALAVSDRMQTELCCLGTNRGDSEREAALGAGWSGSFISYEDPLSTCALIGSAQLVITEKLHPAIVAFRLGVPTLTVSSASKTRAFYSETGRSTRLCENVNRAEVRRFLAQLAQLPDESLAAQDEMTRRARRLRSAFPRP